MVDRLGSLTRAIATLRRNLDRAASASAPVADRAARAQQPPPEGGQAVQSHVGTLASRLAVLQRDDPLRNRKALKLFIEAVLLDELGGELILSTEFERLVERSLAAIEQDDSLREVLLQATQDLFPEP